MFAFYIIYYSFNWNPVMLGPVMLCPVTLYIRYRHKYNAKVFYVFVFVVVNNIWNIFYYAFNNSDSKHGERM